MLRHPCGPTDGGVLDALAQSREAPDHGGPVGGRWLGRVVRVSPVRDPSRGTRTISRGVSHTPGADPGDFGAGQAACWS